MVTFASGSHIGHYTIERQISAGGISNVYLAHDAATMNAVAIKVLQTDANPGLQSRFRREAEISLRFRHPNIVQTLDVGVFEQTTFIVFDYMDGGSLAEKLRDTVPSIATALDIVNQVGRGLKYVHQHGIVHRDVKPSNILFSSTGRVAIGDFGIVLTRGESVLTGEGLTLGTPLYMSPEQARGQSVDYRSDIFSLGTILYELLTGRPPFEGDNSWEILHRLTTTHPPPPSTVNQAIPTGLDRVVMKSIAKEPNKRFQTMAEFVVAVERAEKEVASSKAAAERPNTLEGTNPPLKGRSGIASFISSLRRLWSKSSVRSSGRNRVPVEESYNYEDEAIQLEITDNDYSFEKPQKRSSQASDPSGTQMLPPYNPTTPPTAIIGYHQTPLAWLVALTGPRRGHQYSLTNEHTFGRDDLKDRSVSRYHARIRIEGESFVIYDLASSNGTYVNGVAVYRSELSDRDQIRMGQVVLLFVIGIQSDEQYGEAKYRVNQLDVTWDQLKTAWD